MSWKGGWQQEGFKAVSVLICSHISYLYGTHGYGAAGTCFSVEPSGSRSANSSARRPEASSASKTCFLKWTLALDLGGVVNALKLWYKIPYICMCARMCVHVCMHFSSKSLVALSDCQKCPRFLKVKNYTLRIYDSVQTPPHVSEGFSLLRYSHSYSFIHIHPPSFPSPSLHSFDSLFFSFIPSPWHAN